MDILPPHATNKVCEKESLLNEIINNFASALGKAEDIESNIREIKNKLLGETDQCSSVRDPKTKPPGKLYEIRYMLSTLAEIHGEIMNHCINISKET